MSNVRLPAQAGYSGLTRVVGDETGRDSAPPFTQ